MKNKYVYDFPRPSVTATIGLFIQSPHRYGPYAALVGRRGRKDGAYAGYLCLPGGFLDAKVEEKDIYIEETDDQESSFKLGRLIRAIYALATSVKDAFIAKHVKPGETVEQTAIREIEEETGLKITEDRLVLAHVHSNPDTDPRCHVVNICYYVMITEEEANSAVAGDDLEDLEMPLIGDVDSLTLAFNHNEMYRKMLAAVKRDFPDTEEM
jgi:ADP-ribose pyrophosphatase YjhB (NUDIX family)